ncbi:MAG: alanine--tRNA ligase, partial [Phycisphaerae bacterium]|nr:alanine--tRNA ligase [Phycisphaerae bacterium]
NVDNAFRVIADHVRMLTFAIADGAMPSNDGRGYVLRRVLRRAARFGRQQLGQTEPFLHCLVPALVETMGGVFPELKANPDRVADVIRDEEASFGRTLDRGIALFGEAARHAGASKRISGEDAFKLYDTFGFPFDLTAQMAEERGLVVDEAGFNAMMTEAKRKARESAKKHVAIAFDGELPATDERPKYAGRETAASMAGWVRANTLVCEGQLTAADGEVGLVLDRTSFYAEQGGQTGDTGTVTAPTGTFEVDDTTRLGEGVLHIGRVTDGHLDVGQAVVAVVSEERDHTRRNHTATHLLHWALRGVLGEHVTQRGSLVEPDRLRFDFDHNQPVTPDEAAEIERRVNEKIYADLPVNTTEMPTDEAQKLPGVRAFFGDKYGDAVRVVDIGDGFSREFCGGTHLSRTGEAGFFKIVGEEAVAKGVRRITAVTGRGAVAFVHGLERSVREAAGLLKTGPDQLAGRVGQLQDEIKTLRKQLQKGAAADLRTHRQKLLDAAETINGHRLIVGEVPQAPVEQLREAADWLRTEAGSAAILLGMNGEGGKPMLLAAVTDDLVKKGLHAGNLVKAIAEHIDGRGGGKPNLAQAGGKDPAGIPRALEAGAESLRGQLT